MRNVIVIALLAVSVNCQAMDIWDLSISDALNMVQQRRSELLERQLQEQLRQTPLARRR